MYSHKEKNIAKFKHLLIFIPVPPFAQNILICQSFSITFSIRTSQQGLVFQHLRNWRNKKDSHLAVNRKLQFLCNECWSFWPILNGDTRSVVISKLEKLMIWFSIILWLFKLCASWTHICFNRAQLATFGIYKSQEQVNYSEIHVATDFAWYTDWDLIWFILC